MLTNQNILDMLINVSGTLTLDQVTTALASVDQASLLTNEESHLHVALWDKISAVNGTAANVILSSYSASGISGSIYSISDDRSGAIIVLQPNRPGADGYVSMTDEDYTTYSDPDKLSYCTQNADASTVIAVKTALGM
jgi:hypothetical protein